MRSFYSRDWNARQGSFTPSIGLVVGSLRARAQDRSATRDLGSCNSTHHWYSLVCHFWHSLRTSGLSRRPEIWRQRTPRAIREEGHKPSPLSSNSGAGIILALAGVLAGLGGPCHAMTGGGNALLLSWVIGLPTWKMAIVALGNLVVEVLPSAPRSQLGSLLYFDPRSMDSDCLGYALSRMWI